VIYLDSSAFVKLWRAEPESAALQEWWRSEAESTISSRLSVVEVHRALWRAGAADRTLADALELVVAVATLPLDPMIEPAVRAEPPVLLSLDALHLASALSLGPALDALCTYDDRMTQAARDRGIATIAPGRA
jgi:predicted nucleic acid-binding protein